MKKHIEYKQEEDERFRCVTCNIKHDCLRSLVNHVRATHKEEKPFVCVFCSKNFAKGKTLKDHLKLHERKEEFECHFCKELLPDYVLYKKHRYGHSELYDKDAKMFVCRPCGFKATSWNDLIRHDIHVHNDERPFECVACSTKFKSELILKKHRLSKQHQTAVALANEKLIPLTVNNNSLDPDFATRGISIEGVDKTNPFIGDVVAFTSVIKETSLPLAVAVFQQSMKKENFLKIIWVEKLEADVLTMAVTISNCLICLIGKEFNTIEQYRRKHTVQENIICISNQIKEWNFTTLSSRINEKANDRIRFKSLSRFEDSLVIDSNTQGCIHFMRQSQINNLKQLISHTGSQIVICNI